ncbi:MAG: alkaline phosphatase family protein [Bacteroidia bacterium]
MKKLYLFILLCLSISVHASQKRKVLIIGMAGVRSDALQKANTPTLDGLITNGFYTYTSWHRGHTLSAPAWSTIMCGVEYEKHKVEDNTYTGNNYANYPYFTARAKSCVPNLYSAQIVQWAPMSDNLPKDFWSRSIKVAYGAGDQSVSAAQTQLANSNLDVLFVCFDEADIVGHNTGFSPDNADYIKAIETVDTHINSIITSLHNRPDYANEDWIILLTTDYGGIGTTHGTNTDQERVIWWVGVGNRMGSHQPSSTQDPGSIAMNNYDPVKGAKNPGQYDIAVTALDHLLRDSPCKVPLNPSWGFDGKSWLDSLHTDTPSGIVDINKKQLEVKLFPNPSTDIITCWYENENQKRITFRVLNAMGEKVNLTASSISNNKLNLDFSDQPKAIYYLELLIDNQKATKKIVHQ